jgi:hypothetical protein
MTKKAVGLIGFKVCSDMESGAGERVLIGLFDDCLDPEWRTSSAAKLRAQQHIVHYSYAK